MMHKSRRYVVRAMATLADTVAKLAHGNYCGCVSISFNGTVYLNDATSGDGVEEWAVFRNGRQVAFGLRRARALHTRAGRACRSSRCT